MNRPTATIALAVFVLLAGIAACNQDSCFVHHSQPAQSLPQPAPSDAPPDPQTEGRPTVTDGKIPGIDKSEVVTARKAYTPAADQRSEHIHITILRPREDTVVWFGVTRGAVQFIERFDVDGRPFCYRVFFTPIRSNEEATNPSKRILASSHYVFYDKDGDGSFETQVAGEGARNDFVPDVPGWAQSIHK